MLKFNNVTKEFGRIRALDNISFDVDEGEFIFIIGPSGAGKTTLIRLVLRELLPDSGEIILDGEDLTKIKDNQIPKMRQRIGVVFQDFKVIPERTLRENVEVVLAVSKVPESEWKSRVEHVLKLVGLLDRIDLFPSQLSGGELQRASLARALVINPKILLADEPTGNLDWETADTIVSLFDKVNKEGKTVIVATHNREIIAKFKHRVIEIKDGKLVKDNGKKKAEKEINHSDKKEEKPESEKQGLDDPKSDEKDHSSETKEAKNEDPSQKEKN